MCIRDSLCLTSISICWDYFISLYVRWLGQSAWHSKPQRPNSIQTLHSGTLYATPTRDVLKCSRHRAMSPQAPTTNTTTPCSVSFFNAVNYDHNIKKTDPTRSRICKVTSNLHPDKPRTLVFEASRRMSWLSSNPKHLNSIQGNTTQPRSNSGLA